jgi:hypothetical protein
MKVIKMRIVRGRFEGTVVEMGKTMSAIVWSRKKHVPSLRFRKVHG